ncbi:MAG: type II toxin-antitoxin system VapC family toxin [Nitrosospira sp.]
MTGKPRIYWDTAPLIAWITDEQRPPDEIAGLEEVVNLIERGKIILFTSAIWRVEVLDSSLNEEQKQTLRKLFDGRHITDVAADSRIFDLAHEIRNYYQIERQKDQNQPKISTPDALHLATAILNNATEFHTFDGATQNGGIGKLIRLSGNVAGYKLKICVPTGKQFRLPFEHGNKNHSSTDPEQEEEQD